MFWKRKTPPEANPEREEMHEELYEEMHQDVRDHHYVLAHIALRQACESDPEQFFSLMESGQGGGLMAHLWEQVCGNSEAEPQGIEISTLQIALCQVKGSRAVLIVMPEARRIAEAIMILVVEAPAIPGMEASHLPFRYFTLELGEGENGAPCGVFSEWAGNSHLNYGAGPMPDAKGFKAWVEHHLGEG